MKLVLSIVAALLSLSVVQCSWTYDVYYKWKGIEYNLPPNVQLNSSEYVQQHNIISLVRVYENRMWITTPRFLRGVPVTLSTLPYRTPDVLPHDESPKLEPFPSYEMNKLGDCNALQGVTAVEIDQFGRLWVVDIGRVNALEPYRLEGLALNFCPAKLLIFDVKRGRSDLIFTYVFPDDVAPRTTNILKTMQVACETEVNCWAFLPDISSSKLVVYDHKNRQSWTAEHPTMAANIFKSIFAVDGVPVVLPIGINIIALAPRKYNFSDLYFAPLASTTLYKIKTERLKNPALKRSGTLRMNDVINFGEIPGQSDGMTMSSKGELFYGNVPGNSVMSTKTSPKLMSISEQKIVVQSDVDLLWPNGIAFDGEGKLLLTSNKFHLSGNTDPKEYNYRVMQLRRKQRNDKLTALH